MSSFLNCLIPHSRAFDLVFRGVVLFLDQIDVVSMHTVACDVRDVVRAFRVSFVSEFSSVMHCNGFLRRCGRIADERAHYCVYLTQ
jgi:hypothetical protein